MKIWSRTPQNFVGTKLSKSTVWVAALAPSQIRIHIASPKLVNLNIAKMSQFEHIPGFTISPSLSQADPLSLFISTLSASLSQANPLCLSLRLTLSASLS